MSDLLSSAAATMGVPEALVRRSAEARAKATGAAVDEILAAWAGGEAAPGTAAPPPTEPEAPAEPVEETTTDAPPPAQQEAPAPAAAATPQPAAPPRAAPPSTPPVLVGRRERLVTTAAAAITLLGVSLLIGVVAPSVPEETNTAYTSDVDFSATALDGQRVYRSSGCAGCHTQVVRAVVADATLGPVTVSDTNQVIGVRRIGPDLAHVGSRVETDIELYDVLEGAEGHPPAAGLDQAELDALVVYLLESA